MCVVEWTYGSSVCVGEWTCVGAVCDLNGHMELLHVCW